ncbi:transcription antitermination factor NusB [Spiroplasma endosymbiont of Polydrusus cervinus]|uniref:transcription antitermination factor NusB n=1 Tax=Spiroplasma endosymbiont of Polydrusus cervinus TaxID=3066287 RepID=UPI0030CE0D6D
MQAKELAWNILWKIFGKNKLSNQLLSNIIEKNDNFSDQDKTLIYRIVYGTLKNKLYLEYIANQFINANKIKQIKNYKFCYEWVFINFSFRSNS